MEDKDKVLELLDQILKKAIFDDEQHKTEAIQNNKGNQAIGESWMVFHLKALKSLIEK